MKNFLCLLALIVVSVPFVFVGPGAADCDTVTGLWNFDMGGGYKASVDYKADGTFVQTMTGMTINGKYTVKGKKLTTDVSGAKTDFTIVSCDGNKLTLKRDRDGRTMVYSK